MDLNYGRPGFGWSRSPGLARASAEFEPPAGALSRTNHARVSYPQTQGKHRPSAPTYVSSTPGRVTAVRDFIKQYVDGAFSPEEVSNLRVAFDDAWRRVEASKAPYGAEEYALAARSILARHIIRAAKAGEVDPAGWPTARFYICRGRNSVGCRRRIWHNRPICLSCS